MDSPEIWPKEPFTLFHLCSGELDKASSLPRWHITQIPKKTGATVKATILTSSHQVYGLPRPDVLEGHYHWESYSVCLNVIKATSLPKDKTFFGIWDYCKQTQEKSPPKWSRFLKILLDLFHWFHQWPWSSILRTGLPERRLLPSHEARAPKLVWACQRHHHQWVCPLQHSYLPHSLQRKSPVICLQPLFFRKHEAVHFQY